MGYTPTAATYHDDLSCEEVEEGDPYQLGTPLDPSLEGSSIGKDHLYHD